MLHSGREPVVVVVARGINPSDRTEAWNGTACLYSKRLARLIREGLIVIGQNREPQAVIPVICQLNHRILSEFSLHRKEPVLNVGPSHFGWDVDNIGVGWIEAGRVRY